MCAQIHGSMDKCLHWPSRTESSVHLLCLPILVSVYMGDIWVAYNVWIAQEPFNCTENKLCHMNEFLLDINPVECWQTL